MTTPDSSSTSTTSTSTTTSSESVPRRMDARLRAAFVTVIVSASLFAGVAAFAWSVRAAISIGVGGVLAAGNLYVIARIVLSLMPANEAAGAEPDPASAAAGKRAWSVLALFKMILLFGGVWLLMKERLVDPIPLLVGFGALPIGIAIGSVVSDRTAKT